MLDLFNHTLKYNLSQIDLGSTIEKDDQALELSRSLPLQIELETKGIDQPYLTLHMKEGKVVKMNHQRLEHILLETISQVASQQLAIDATVSHLHKSKESLKTVNLDLKPTMKAKEKGRYYQTFKITILGQSGHGSTPHETRDAVVATSSLVQDLQLLISRESDPQSHRALSITRIQAGGEAYNIIAGKGEIEGMIYSDHYPALLDMVKSVERRLKTFQAHTQTNIDVAWGSLLMRQRLANQAINIEELDMISKTCSHSLKGKQANKLHIALASDGEDVNYGDVLSWGLVTLMIMKDYIKDR